MDETVGEVTHRYLTLADELMPGGVTGLYLVGSVALDDYRPGLSDVDVVAVTGERLGNDDLEVLADLHRRLADEFATPVLEGIYVTADDLKADPRGLDGRPRYRGGETAAESGLDVALVQWLTLHSRPLSLRGPDAPDVWADPQAAHRWALDRLNGHWSEWLARQQTLVGRGTMMLPDDDVERGVLGIPRIHYTLATGKVTSKSGAGEYALATFDAGWQPIVTEALRIRQGGEQSEDYRRRPLARRRDALAFMEHVIADANARHAAG